MYKNRMVPFEILLQTLEQDDLRSLTVSPEREDFLNQSRTLLFRDPGQSLTTENKFYLHVLETGCLFDISLSGTIGYLPNDELFNKWSSDTLTDTNIVDPFERISEIISRVKTKDYANSLIVDSTGSHAWDLDFEDVEKLDIVFGYLNKNKVHTRRVEMIADLIISGIKDSLKEKEEVTVVDIGSGIFSLEKAATSRLTSEENRRVHFVGVDVSEDLLRYGLESQYIDKGVRVDLSEKGAEDYFRLFPKVDVVIFSEILEHMPHVGIEFKEKVLPWLVSNNVFVVGSVPNAIKLVDHLPLIAGLGSPNVLRRPFFDRTNDHSSHFTVATLAELLENEWGFQEYGITSNAVPLDRKADVCDLFAGMNYPSMGTGLIFWGKCGKK